MCLIFLSLNHHPRYKLIVAANRDEFYNRPTTPADFWEDAPSLLAGRDLEAKGTWLGITRQGRFGLLTNYRDPKNIHPNAPSRGHLVTDYLLGEMSGKEYMEVLEPRSKTYNGFNLIVGSPSALWYYSNYGQGTQSLSPGFYGLSNALLDTPWPKVEQGKSMVSRVLEQDRVEPEALFEVLCNDKPAPDNKLPDTGVGLARERALSSMFIKSPNYGSRCSTVVLVDRNNHVTFSERVFDLTTFAHTTRNFEFDA